MVALSEIQAPSLAEEPGLGSLTLPGFIAEIAATFNNREALRWRDLAGVQGSWSYAELYDASLAVARSLLAVGVGRGTRVGLLASNRPEWLCSMFGASIAGAVVVSLSTFSTKSELEYQLRVADVEILIMEGSVASHNFVDDIFSICPDLSTSRIGGLFYAELPFLRRVICLDKEQTAQGLQSWDEFLTHGKNISTALTLAVAKTTSPVDDALIFFSSGSTAKPKAIRQTHRAAALQCWRFSRWYETDNTVRTWSANGLFWSGVFAQALGATLSVGGCLILQRFFDPDESLALIQAEKVSLTLAWPHQEARLRESSGWANVDLSALVLVDSEGIMASHPSVKCRGRQLNGYGSTETFTFVTGIEGSNNTGTHGPVIYGNCLRIVDPDTGAILPMGEIGEIAVKGPTLMTGYLKTAPEDTFDAEGFFHTGDAGYITSEGHLLWKGRLSDIIKTGGANVSPAEIDAVLAEHPAIQSAFTVGVPHETLGEIIVSCVLLKEGQTLDEDSVRSFAKGRLASYKIPRQVLCLAENELPTTGSNKIRSSELRALAAARLSLNPKG